MAWREVDHSFFFYGYMPIEIVWILLIFAEFVFEFKKLGRLMTKSAKISALLGIGNLTLLS